MISNYPPTHVDIRIYARRGYIQYHDGTDSILYNNKLDTITSSINILDCYGIARSCIA